MIHVDQLQFAYRRGEALYDELSLDFAAGSVTALTGPSGRGKSTLLYLLGLLLRPDAGEVVIGQVSTRSLSDAQRARLRAAHIGFVFQDAALDSTRTVMDNVTESALYAGMGRRQARRQAADLLERFGVGLRGDHRPGQVSGGQAQRVALCRALLQDPPIVLADEPTGNLDQDSAKSVLDAFREIADQGACVVVATHDPAVVARCQRHVRL